jgi:hypothetical protein
MTDQGHTHFYAAPPTTIEDIQTAHHRPMTARSSARDDDSADYVVAVIQGRGRYYISIRLTLTICRSWRRSRSSCNQLKHRASKSRSNKDADLQTYITQVSFRALGRAS